MVDRASLAQPGCAPHQTSRAVRVMGILNCTPDSFHDGGCRHGVDDYVAAALQMAEDGADIIDIGGESTRPGAAPVALVDEMERVLPVIRAFRRVSDLPISIDTYKPEVAEAALSEGASIVNDIRGLREPGMLRAVACSGATVVIMHMLGEPRTMQREPEYADVTKDVYGFLERQTDAALQAGIAPEKIVWDPGFGFGKTQEHNLTLFRDLPMFARCGYPLLVGVSRKSMIGNATGLPVEDRMVPSVALAVMAAERGASILRVHDVKPTVQALMVARAVLAGGKGGAC